MTTAERRLAREECVFADAVKRRNWRAIHADLLVEAEDARRLGYHGSTLPIRLWSRARCRVLVKWIKSYREGGLALREALLP
jgi:hypothetical protein